MLTRRHKIIVGVGGVVLMPGSAALRRDGTGAIADTPFRPPTRAGSGSGGRDLHRRRLGELQAHARARSPRFRRVSAQLIRYCPVQGHGSGFGLFSVY
ncbi:hypothetical protein AURDEDRAFT_109511 [Auricularia subglabra TFB-10046 SS5]|nr:hypothetical protein AURDEDRAFT_109511 [Auricularia subglabra TFB-10046 SS5]